jgi:hypothetical protein
VSAWHISTFKIQSIYWSRIKCDFFFLENKMWLAMMIFYRIHTWSKVAFSLGLNKVSASRNSNLKQHLPYLTRYLSNYFCLSVSLWTWISLAYITKNIGMKARFSNTNNSGWILFLPLLLFKLTTKWILYF